jgi:hypothetical protein
LNRELFDRVPTGNNNRNIQAGLVLETPRWFIFEAMYREVGATLFQDQLITDPLTRQPILRPGGIPDYSVTGPSGFRRPSAHFAITYKINNNENRTITVSYDQNNNLYARGGIVGFDISGAPIFALPGQNFRERVMQIALLWRFRRQ